MSLEDFISNVTSLTGLTDLLRQAARLEIGTSADATEVDSKAKQLFVDTMRWVGIDPVTELSSRNLIFAALRGEPLNDEKTMRLVEYLLGQMIAKPKGSLAERLARLPCASAISELKQNGAMPPEAGYMVSIWSKQMAPSPDGSGSVEFNAWRDGADGVVYCRPGSYSAKHLIMGEPLELNDDVICILGVVEVKARRILPKGEPKLQLDKHLARLTQGLQIRHEGKVGAQFAPQQVYFARWRGGVLEAIAAPDVKFRIDIGAGVGEWCVNWSTPVAVRQWAIGPNPSKPSRRKSRFDGMLPYSAGELEDFGHDVMHYTLGAMADDRSVDLPGSEWRWNLERLLEAVTKLRFAS